MFKRKISPSLSVNHQWYGSDYGGFYVHPNIITEDSIVYSFGIGEDISFDKKIIEKHNCSVFGFDPTPRSIDWLRAQELPEKFSYFEFGLADRSGTFDFFLPKNDTHISASIIRNTNIDEKKKIQAEFRTLHDITMQLGHSVVDILKLDIEGAEYEVIGDMLTGKIDIRQILIEFHHRYLNGGIALTKKAIRLLRNHDFEIFAVDGSFEEISFIRKDIIK